MQIAEIYIISKQNQSLSKKDIMSEVVYQKTSKSDLLFNKDAKLEKEFLEEGSKDLYDIIKFCCAVKENPISPNLKEWSRKNYTSN